MCWVLQSFPPSACREAGDSGAAWQGRWRHVCAQYHDKFAYIYEITQGLCCVIVANSEPGVGRWLSETSLKYQEPPL